MLTFVCRTSCLLALLLLGTSAQARTFCCEANGRTYCDEGLPTACYGKAYREVNASGVVVKRYDAPLTPEQQAKHDAEVAKQKAEQERLEEEARQNRKLVASYLSLNDLDATHERLLTDMDKAKKQLELKLVEAEKHKKQLGNEAEFYKKKPMPPALTSQIKENTNEIAALQKAIDARVQDIEAAKLRFEEERKRYISLTTGEARLRP